MKIICEGLFVRHAIHLIDGVLRAHYNKELGHYTIILEMHGELPRSIEIGEFVKGLKI